MKAAEHYFPVVPFICFLQILYADEILVLKLHTRGAVKGF